MDANYNVFIVDNDSTTRMLLQHMLSNHFIVEAFESGEACLERAEQKLPNLFLLDVDLPGINGYEACRKLRERQSALPVIFLSSCDTLEERLEAFDSGGNDFLTKPVDIEILLRKAQLAIKTKMEFDQLASEKVSYEQMAMTFLGSLGETGVLHNYTRANFNCPDYASLAENTLKAARDLGLTCHIQLRFPGGTLSCTPNGKANPLQESVLTQVSSTGRLFQFKNRLVTNFEHATLIIMNLPDNPEIVGRIRDNIAILAEIADEFVMGITFRNESAANIELIQKANLTAGSSVEVLRKKYRNQQVETRLLQNELIHDVERSYIHLGLTDSQEHAISEILHNNSEKILQLFEQREEFEKQFSLILNALAQQAQT